ncbi:MAG TPA: carbon storage regulator [Ruminococcaceae bacterium]|nr:carbon storage regulator [Oscillospiraceae bacterium]
MLIIARKPQESFVIGEDIEVVILDVQNDKIRIGINAPKDVSILRKELFDTKKSNQDAVLLSENLKINQLAKEIKKNRK